MSFILDALKKSETDRQERGSAEFAGIPTGGRRREGPPSWLWIVGVLLLINLAVLIGIFLRPEAQPVTAVAQSGPDEPAAVAAPAEQPASTEPATPDEPAADFASQAAAARENAPARDATPQPAEEAAPQPSAGSVTIDRSGALALPMLQEVQARGMVNLPELHVDIHVYSESAEDRFVFINMARYKEGARLAEGPLVTEIIPEGVVLEENGTTFLLPRD